MLRAHPPQTPISHGGSQVAHAMPGSFGPPGGYPGSWTPPRPAGIGGAPVLPAAPAIRTPWLALAAGWVLAFPALFIAVGVWLLPNLGIHQALRAPADVPPSEPHFSKQVIGMLWVSLAAAGLGHHVRKRTGHTRGVALARIAGMLFLATAAGLLRPMWDDTAGSRTRSARASEDRRVAASLAASLREGADRVDAGIDPASLANTKGLSRSMQQRLALARRVVDMQNSAADEYISAAERARPNAMLLPTRLDSGAEILDSQERLLDLRAALDHYDHRLGLMLTRFDSMLADMFTSPGERARVRAEHVGGLESWLDFARVSARNERAVLDEMDHALRFMLERQGRFALDGGVIVFDDDWDSWQFNLSMARIDAIAQIEVARDEQRRDQMRRFADELERGLPPSPILESPRRGPDCAIGRGSMTIGALEVTPSTTERELIDALGPPDRTRNAAGAPRLIWHDAGLVAHTENGVVLDIGVALHGGEGTSIPDFPRRAFAGTLRLLDQEVTGVDTALSVNRRLGGEPLEPIDPDGFEWAMRLDGITTGVVSGPDCLLMLLWVELNTPATPPDHTVSDASPLAMALPSAQL